MKISQAGIDFIKQHEGVRYDSYQDSVGIWTIGVGHTGPDIGPGMVIDDAEVDVLLNSDLAEAEECIEDNCDAPISQNQYDAVCSLIFNIGCSAFKSSTLLALVNVGKYEAAQARSNHRRHGPDRGSRIQPHVRSL